VSVLSRVALTGSLVFQKYLIEGVSRIEPLSHPPRQLHGPGFFIGWRADMPKAVRISPSIASSTSQRSDTYELISVALFSGVGLLISLVAVIAGVQGVWI